MAKTGPKPPKTGPTSPPKSQRKGTRNVIQHFASTHQIAGKPNRAARDLRALYKGGAPTAAQKTAFAKSHPGFVKNNPKVAKRLTGAGKKGT